MISRLSGQDTSNTFAGTTSPSLAYGSPPTAGNLMIASCYYSSTFATITPPPGWQLAVGSDTGNPNSASIFYKVAQSGETSTVAFTVADTGSFQLNIYEYSTDTKSTNWALEKTANANSVNASVNSISTGTTSGTINPNQLLFCAASFAGSGSAPSWTNSFNALLSTARIFNADKIVTTTSSYESTVTITGTAAKMAGAIAGFVENKPSFKVLSVRPHPFSPGLAR